MTPKLTLFYDATCPLCSKEMDALRRHDTHQSLKLINLYSEEMGEYPQIDVAEANKVLHAIDENGQLLLGLDVTHQAWSLVGKGWIYAPLRWPLVKPIADWFYIRFANNRYKISYWLTGTRRYTDQDCSSGTCGIRTEPQDKNKKQARDA